MHRLLQRSDRAEASRRHGAPQSSVSKQKNKGQRHQCAFSNTCCSVFGKEPRNDFTSLPRLKGMVRETIYKRGF